MSLTALAEFLVLLRRDERTLALAAAGDFSSLSVPSMGEDQRGAVQRLAQRLRKGEELPSHLKQDSSVAVWSAD